jgi:hypothetical protein
MISFFSKSKRRGPTLAGIFTLAIASTLLLCGAGAVPIENLLPQGAMQGDLNAGGHSLTNVVVNGTLTVPSSFTLPFSQVTGTPTLGSLSSVSPTGTASSTTFLKYDGTTFSYAVPPGTATSGTSLLYGNGLGGFTNATVGSGLAFSSGTLSANVSSVAGRTGAITLSASDISGLAASATTDTSNASNITSGTLAAARVPVLNQNTTGSAANFTGSLAGDVTGTQGLTVVGKIGGKTVTLGGSFALTGAYTFTGALLGNTTVTFPTSGTLATLGTNTFTGDQTVPNTLILSGPGNTNIVYLGDSRMAMGFGDPSSISNAVGAVNSLPANLQVSGFGYNAFNANYGLSGTGIETALLNYYGANSVSTTGTVTSGSLTVTITGATTGLSGTMLVGGAGIPPGFRATISGTTVTLIDAESLGRTPTASGTGVTLNFSTAVYPYNNSGAGFFSQYLSTPHQLSDAVSGLTGFTIIWEGINDTIGYTYSNCTVTSGSPTITLQTNYLATSALPYMGEIITSTHFPGGTATVTAVAQSGQTITLTASTNATGTSSTESITTTPVLSAWETGYQALVNDALADGQKVVVMTMPEAWSGTLAGGNTLRATENSWMVSTYGGNAVAGVTLCDVASLPFCSTNDPNVYRDGIHFTDSGEAYAATYLNSVLFAAYPSLVANNPLAFGRGATISPDALAPISQLNLGNGGATVPLVIKENTSSYVTMIDIGTGSISYFENTSQGLKVGNSAGNAFYIPTAINGIVPVIPSTTPTPVAGSTSGSATFIQTFNETYKKEVLVYCNALTGTASFTFPTAFTNTPVVVSTTGPATAVVTSLSTTAMTVTGSTTTGPLLVEGY